MWSKWFRVLIVLVVFWILLAGFLLLQLWPNIPRTNLQWYLFAGFGPPLYVLAAEFFGWLLSTRHGYLISDAKISILRILIALPIAILWLLFCRWLSWLISK